MVWINGLLSILSLFSFIIGFYSILTLKIKEVVSEEFLTHIKRLLLEKKHAAAAVSCKQASHYCARILACGLAARSHGYLVLIESMQREREQYITSLREKLSLLHEISFFAPLLGLGGTLWGIFYLENEWAFSSVLIGLGISLMARFFYVVAQFQLSKLQKALDQSTLPLGKYIV